MQVQRARGRGVASSARDPADDRPRRSPDQLLRDAWIIRNLLDDLAVDEHSTRAKLLAARDQVRREAARQWREHGWRPITEEF